MSRVQKRDIRIQRMNDAELDLAISDLEKRGYELVKRDSSEYLISNINYKESSYQPYKVRGHVTHKHVWAVLRKGDINAGN